VLELRLQPLGQEPATGSAGGRETAYAMLENAAAPLEHLMLAGFPRLILSLPSRLRSYAIRAMAWINELRQLWACGFVVALLVLGLAYWRPCDLTYRLIGMSAQLIGVGIAAGALVQAREYFGLLSFGQVWRQWWAKRPRWRADNTISAATGHVVMGGFPASMRINVKYDRMLPVMGRLNKLTDGVEGLHRTLADVDQKLGGAAEAFTKELKALSEKTSADTAKVEEKLKSTQTGGVAVALVAALLVALGTVLTAVPVELAYLFGSSVPTCVFPPVARR